MTKERKTRSCQTQFPKMKNPLCLTFCFQLRCIQLFPLHPIYLFPNFFSFFYSFNFPFYFFFSFFFFKSQSSTMVCIYIFTSLPIYNYILCVLFLLSLSLFCGLSIWPCLTLLQPGYCLRLAYFNLFIFYFYFEKL